MRKGVGQVVWIIVLASLALIWLMMGTPLMAKVASIFDNTITGSSSCEFYGTLPPGFSGSSHQSSGQGGCSTVPRCDEAFGDAGKGYQWQYLGKGFGCPALEEDQSEGSVAQYCCILIPDGKNPIKHTEVAKASCAQQGEGSLGIMIDDEGCVSASAAGASISVDDLLRIKYFLRDSDHKSCEITVKVKVEGYSMQLKNAASDGFSCAVSENTVDINVGDIAYVFFDGKSVLNEGGTLEITVNEGTSTEIRQDVKIRIPNPPFCPETTGACAGKRSGETATPSGKFGTDAGPDTASCILSEGACVLSGKCTSVNDPDNKNHVVGKEVCNGVSVPKKICYAYRNSVFDGKKFESKVSGQEIGTFVCILEAADGQCKQSYLGTGNPSSKKVGGVPVSEKYDGCQ